MSDSYATPWTVAHQVPPSMGFSRQEYWSGLPFPSPGDLPDPGIEPRSPALQADALTSEPPGKPWWLFFLFFSRAAVNQSLSLVGFLKLCIGLLYTPISEVAQLCPTVCDVMDCSLPHSSVHGIFQARVLEWVAISFSRGSSRPRD